MYENGRKLNRHARTRRHIDCQKKRYLKTPYLWSAMGMSFKEYLASLDDFWRHYSYGPRKDFMPGCEQYWRYCYLSSAKTFAKKATSKAIRNYWKQQLAHCEDWEEIEAGMNRSDYQKQFDYDWTVW